MVLVTPAVGTGGRRGGSSSSRVMKIRPEMFLFVMVVVILIVQFALHGPLLREEERRNDIGGGTGSIGGGGDGKISSGGGGGNYKRKPKIGSGGASSSGAGSVVSQSTAAVAATAPGFPDHYTLFSTSCSPSQDWQSYVFFFFAHRVGQPGKVVRIASGCSEEQRAELQAFHDEKVKIMSEDFYVHFTPDFTKQSGDNYKYYNKPFGVRHWLKYGLEFDKNRESHLDAIIMILDPDMALLRPLTYDFTDSNVIIHQSKRGIPTDKRVKHGQPWASIYAFGNGPFRLDREKVFANMTDSPALKTSSDEQANSFPGGPPYMATGKDMHAIVQAWCDIVPKVHAVYEHLLGEMYGWSLAAAHLELPHYLSESFMVSATQSPGEGWPLVDAIPKEEACMYPVKDMNAMPYVIHYCQNYWIGKWFSGKYRLDKHFLSCDTPLMMEPPDDVGLQYDYYIKPGGKPYGTKEKMNSVTVHRETFMACQMIKRLNEVATWYKDHHCQKETANYEKSFIFHHHLDPNNIEGGEKSAKW